MRFTALPYPHGANKEIKMKPAKCPSRAGISHSLKTSKIKCCRMVGDEPSLTMLSLESELVLTEQQFCLHFSYSMMDFAEFIYFL